MGFSPTPDKIIAMIRIAAQNRIYSFPGFRRNAAGACGEPGSTPAFAPLLAYQVRGGAFFVPGPCPGT